MSAITTPPARELRPTEAFSKSVSLSFRVNGDALSVRVEPRVSLLDLLRERPRDFDLSAYWAESTVQFEKDIYVGTARVRASELGLRRLKEISQTVKEAVEAAVIAPDQDGWAELVIPIEEVAWATREMRRVGSEIEVLEPAELRTRIAEEARKMAALYAEPAGS